MEPYKLKDFSKFAEMCAVKSGSILKKFWGSLRDIRQKGFSWDVVTEADLASEAVIIKEISEAFPDHTVLSEEAGLLKKGSSEYAWVIDPLDGTTNYTHQYPIVSVSIALLYRDKPVVGVVYNPILEEMFVASLGNGSWLNKNRISVSKITVLEKSLLATGFAYDRKDFSENNYAEFCHITHLSQGVRRGGSAAIDLAYVAAGRLDGYWERGLNPWDIAAGVLLIEEAGGKVTSYEGTDLILESGRILATNGVIHNLLAKELKKVREGNTERYF